VGSHSMSTFYSFSIKITSKFIFMFIINIYYIYVHSIFYIDNIYSIAHFICFSYRVFLSNFSEFIGR